MENKGIEYARQCVAGKKPVGKYVKKQCQALLDIYDGKVADAHFDERRYNRLCKLLKIMINPKGINVGKSFYDSLYGFQWMLLIAVYCIVDDEGVRLYHNLILEIARKNGKSQVSGLIMLIAMLTEPRFSKLYSISVNAQLARETYDAMKEILLSSPVLFDESLISSNGKQKAGHFHIRFNDIVCLATDNIYTPLGNNPRALDGKLMSFAIADECGALPDNGPIEAIRSSQITLREKLTIVLSTKYPGVNNPMENEVHYCKQVLDGVIDDRRTFALLYEPDENIQKQWQTNDLVMKQANPLAVEIPMMWEALMEKRTKAIEAEGSRGYFLTKNCNIMAALNPAEMFVPIDSVKAAQVPAGSIDWRGRDVYVGIDLSLSGDTTSYVMAAFDDDGNVIVKPHIFIPADRVEAKCRVERVPYDIMIERGYCQSCGDMVIDYKFIEDQMLKIEETYGCNVVGFYADPWHATATVQRLEAEGYPVTLIKQVSYVLGGPTQYLKELMMQGRIKFEENPLYVIQYDNCKACYDTNINIYINKKMSEGKIDGVAATIDALYALYQETYTDTSFGAYTI